MSYTYPGVYIQEPVSPVHTIVGVATSIAAFVGYTAQGIDNRAQMVESWGDYERLYGGLAPHSELSYAVQQFFQNGGTQAYVVRVPMDQNVAAEVTFDELTFTALSSGKGANNQLLVDIDWQNIDISANANAFNVTVTNLAGSTPPEAFPGVTLDTTSTSYVATVINDPDNGSQLVSVTANAATAPTAPVYVSGLLGAATTAGAITGLVVGATAGVAQANYGFQLTTTTPAAPPTGLPVTVTVFSQGSPVATTLTGIVAQLQQALNQALALAVPGASARCSLSPLTASATDTAIRVNVLLPGVPDAVVAIEPPPAAVPGQPPAPTDLSGALGLAKPTSANVAHYALGGAGSTPLSVTTTPGSDGTGLPTGPELTGDPLQFHGMYALEKVPLFNLLSFPDLTRAQPGDPSALALPKPAVLAVYAQAIGYCVSRRAFLLVDPPPDVTTVPGAIDWISDTLNITDSHGAAFWPRLRLADPLNSSNLRTFAPSGVVAGVYASNDGASGVWTAPAGIQAQLSGVQAMTYQLSDPENGQLNPLGLNCFRTFPVVGSVLWGARTLAGADALGSEWKYVPVRRTALFLESSLYQSLQWVVFQPNDEPLWASIRLNVGSFMQTLFLKGAFQGQTPDQAYFVKCDSETTTQADINAGVVNILVGFAPLSPAEFVVIQIEQLTGQAQS
ncbi:MAG: phage tail sheath family protein [Solirubrobacteraceae bacterium]